MTEQTTFRPNIPDNIDFSLAGKDAVDLQPLALTELEPGTPGMVTASNTLTNLALRCAEVQSPVIIDFFPEMAEPLTYASDIVESLRRGGRAGYDFVLSSTGVVGRAEYCNPSLDGEFQNTPLEEIYKELSGGRILGLNTCLAFADPERTSDEVHLVATVQAIRRAMELKPGTCPWLPIADASAEEMRSAEPSYGWWLLNWMREVDHPALEQLEFEVYIGGPRNDWDLRSNQGSDPWLLRPAIAIPRS